MPICEIDLRPGGAWRFVWRNDDGSEMTMQGVYREIVAPERLISTDECWGDEWPKTINTLLLDEKGGKTTITNRILHPSQQARDAALKSGMQDGIAASFDRLETYLLTVA